jgi:hypothetical protein
MEISKYMQERRLSKSFGVKDKEVVEKEPKPLKKNSDNQLPLLLKKAQAVFNEFIRLRDKGKCICGCKKEVTHAGHYYPLGSYSGVRFDEVNVNGIAESCNYFSDAAIDSKYESGLLKKIGKKEMEWLKKRATETKRKTWEREELQEIISEYSHKLKDLKHRK